VTRRWRWIADDPQKLVQDDNDQKYLDSLPELEREAILADRFETMKNEARYEARASEYQAKGKEKPEKQTSLTTAKEGELRKAKAAKVDTTKDAD
jgi:RNA polymerase-associated protein RTF1